MCLRHTPDFAQVGLGRAAAVRCVEDRPLNQAIRPISCPAPRCAMRRQAKGAATIGPLLGAQSGVGGLCPPLTLPKSFSEFRITPVALTAPSRAQMRQKDGSRKDPSNPVPPRARVGDAQAANLPLAFFGSPFSPASPTLAAGRRFGESEAGAETGEGASVGHNPHDLKTISCSNGLTLILGGRRRPIVSLPCPNRKPC